MIYWQSNGKAEKFSCVLLRLAALREFIILVSSDFESVGMGPQLTRLSPATLVDSVLALFSFLSILVTLLKNFVCE